MAEADPFQQQAPIKVRLPHPFLTTYHLERSSKPVADGRLSFGFRETLEPGKPAPPALINDQLSFSRLPAAASDNIDEADNTAWARARRSPVWAVTWDGKELPSVAQVWLFLYTFFTVEDVTESVRLRLEGSDAKDLAESLRLSMVAIDLPQPADAPSVQSDVKDVEVLVVRSSFWQGCASPLGIQPIWLPTWKSANVVPHVDYTFSAAGYSSNLRHPRRPPKPEPGSIMYSRYIPSLDEHFSLQAIDFRNAAHLELFHKWQNDPRVAAGWMESGTLEHHRAYLRVIHDDPHQIAVFGCFNDVPFAYYEIYWAKEDKMGAHYASKDFDRGRHALVGDDTYRGRHRVMAWWPSIMHYVFLDDHRTENVVGEPRLSNAKVLKYEYMFGLHQDQYLDLPHKRSNLVVCSRERFFQLCPFNQGPGVAGTAFGFQSLL